MLSLLAIFLLNLILLFVLLKVSNFIFNYQEKLKSAKSSIYWTITAFCCVFLLSLIVTFGSAKLIANFISSQKLSGGLDTGDCLKLLDTINSVENKLEKIDNHRNIEDTSPLFTVKIEYQQGATQLRESASRYEKLNLSEKSKLYSQNVVLAMQAKANYYEERTNLISDREGTKKILQLLKKMDRVTQERENAIATIEKQCTFP